MMKSLFVLTILLAGGCGTTLPSQELRDARSSFARARGGPAAELVPADLHTAEEALDRAEASFRDEGNGYPSRDLAYIAHRRVLFAEARAAQEVALRRQADAHTQIERIQAGMHEMTAQELSRTRAALTDRQRELAVRQEQLAQGQRELATERQARQEAEQRATAAMESLQKIASVREEQRGTVITLSGSVLFASGESQLLPIAQQRLDQVAATLVDQGATSIIVEGHTDSRGSRRQNSELALARATSVVSYLVSKGVPSNSIRPVGIGPDRPVADNSSAEGRANNRRVEIIIEPQRAGGAAPPAR